MVGGCSRCSVEPNTRGGGTLGFVRREGAAACGSGERRRVGRVGGHHDAPGRCKPGARGARGSPRGRPGRSAPGGSWGPRTPAARSTGTRGRCRCAAAGRPPTGRTHRQGVGRRSERRRSERRQGGRRRSERRQGGGQRSERQPVLSAPSRWCSGPDLGRGDGDRRRRPCGRAFARDPGAWSWCACGWCRCGGAPWSACGSCRRDAASWCCAGAWWCRGSSARSCPAGASSCPGSSARASCRGGSAPAPCPGRASAPAGRPSLVRAAPSARAPRPARAAAAASAPPPRRSARRDAPSDRAPRPRRRRAAAPGSRRAGAGAPRRRRSRSGASRGRWPSSRRPPWRGRGSKERRHAYPHTMGRSRRFATFAPRRAGSVGVLTWRWPAASPQSGG